MDLDLEGPMVSGSYKPVRDVSGRIFAVVRCPDCQRRFSLSRHEVDSKGVVTPSVVCPYD